MKFENGSRLQVIANKFPALFLCFELFSLSRDPQPEMRKAILLMTRREGGIGGVSLYSDRHEGIYGTQFVVCSER